MRDEYFNWLYNHVVDHCMTIMVGSYNKLLEALYDATFKTIIPFDENRVSDALTLRDIFTEETGLIPRDVPCSVLEVLIGLSVRCEDQIMKDQAYGDRSVTWFWEMIGNMGLSDMTDNNYDSKYVAKVITCFVMHDYKANIGCAFRSDIHKNLEPYELWQQMNFHLNDILGGT